MEKLKNRLREGDQIFYYDGYTQWNIETVETVNKKDRTATLSNNTVISRYPNLDGTFDKLNPTGGRLPYKPNATIMKATPELIKLQKAIVSRNNILYYLSYIDSKIKGINPKNWKNWSDDTIEDLISISSTLSKIINK